MKSKMKRRVAVIVLALLICLSTFSFGITAENEPVEIKLLCASHTSDIHEELAEIFNESQDEIVIKVDGSPSGWDGVSTKLITLLSGGEPVDIATVSTSYYPQFVALDQVLDITDHARETYSEEEYYWSIFDGLMFDDHLYGVPISIYTLINYINKDMYDANDVEYPSLEWGDEAWSFEDWKNVAFELTEGDGLDRIYGAWIQFQLERTACFLFPEDLNYWGEDLYPQFDDEEIRSIHEEVYSMLHEDEVIPNASMVETTGMAQLFADGVVANFITGTWDHANIYESGVNFGCSPTPGGVTVGYVDVYIPLKNTQNEAETLKVLDYLISYDACMYKYENNELGPQVNKLATEDSADNCFAGLTKEERECIFESLENNKPLTVFPEWAEFLSDSLLPISSLMEYGEETVDEGFDQLQENALELLGY